MSGFFVEKKVEVDSIFHVCEKNLIGFSSSIHSN